MKITLANLSYFAACHSQSKLFEQMWYPGMEINEENVYLCLYHFDVDWLIQKLFSYEAWTKYTTEEKNIFTRNESRILGLEQALYPDEEFAVARIPNMFFPHFAYNIVILPADWGNIKRFEQEILRDLARLIMTLVAEDIDHIQSMLSRRIIEWRQ